MKRMFEEYPDVVSVPELKEMLKVSERTAYSMLRNGEIRSIRIGNRYRIPKQFVINYLIHN